jgi:hypothetical protein
MYEDLWFTYTSYMVDHTQILVSYLTSFRIRFGGRNCPSAMVHANTATFFPLSWRVGKCKSLAPLFYAIILHLFLSWIPDSSTLKMLFVPEIFTSSILKKLWISALFIPCTLAYEKCPCLPDGNIQILFKEWSRLSSVCHSLLERKFGTQLFC